MADTPVKRSSKIVGLPVALLVASAIFLAATNHHYPISQWLFWRYASYWLLCALFTLSCLSIGHRLLRRFLPVPSPIAEHLLLSFALGCFVFFVGMFIGGILHLYGGILFWALPSVLTAAGGPSFGRYVRRALAGIRHARAQRRTRAASSLSSYVLFAFGVIALAIIYGGILIPDNVAYDARWYHLALAEHYVAQGGIRKFVEGWYFGAYPQLASILYTWAFLLPGGALFDHVELAAHLEFTLFLWTLAAIPLVVRRIVPGTRARSAWIAPFLFPGIFLYDSSLTGASDHITAFWAPPILIVLSRALPRLEPRACALLAMMLAGALLTKYQAVYLLAGPALALVGRALWLAWRTRRLSWLKGPACCLAVGLIATAPHWLKNWLYYADPIYPYLHLATHPLQVDAGWSPVGSAGAKAGQVAAMMATFSFIPHDWAPFHGAVPVFGSLFTLGLLALPWLRGTRRIWGLAAMTQLGVLIWAATFHQDRYLQLLLPWMAATTWATFILVWRTQRASRVALGVLVAVQLIWAGDIPFFPTHAMLHDVPLKRSIELLSAGYRKQYENRFSCLSPFSDIAERLPPRSKVLVHDLHVKLGLGAMTVSDAFGWQGELDYARLGSPRAVYEQLRAWGITHLLWDTNREPSHRLADDLLFYTLATRDASQPIRVGSISVARMPSSWRDEPSSSVVLVLGCGSVPAPGLYPIDDLAHATRVLAADETPAMLLSLAGAAIVDEGCARSTMPELWREFSLVGHHGAQKLWLRRKPPAGR